MSEQIIYLKTPTQLPSLDAECYILDTSLDEDFLTTFINQALKEEKITLFFGKDEQTFAKKFGATGIIIDTSIMTTPLKDLTPIRKSLGKNSIIGLITRNRRHETMLTAELEPDFIIFKAWLDGLDKTTELLNWYNDFFLIQSALFPLEEIDHTNIKKDFIIKTI